MFLGQYVHALDVKGRLTIPAQLRSELSTILIVTRGSESCLVVYPQDAWIALASKIARAPASNAAVRAYRRLFFGGAFEAVLDKMGRLLLPAVLRSHAGLEIGQEVVIVGADTYIELWQPEYYRQALAENTLNLPQILSDMSQMGV
jgi:MraZ protein